MKERIEHTRSDKEKEALKNELMRLKKVVTTAETTLKNYQSEVHKPQQPKPQAATRQEPTTLTLALSPYPHTGR